MRNDTYQTDNCRQRVTKFSTCSVFHSDENAHDVQGSEGISKQSNVLYILSLQRSVEPGIFLLGIDQGR